MRQYTVTDRHTGPQVNRMNGSIFLVRPGNSLVELRESGYDSEAVLQTYLADHPTLLPGDQISPDAPVAAQAVCIDPGIQEWTYWLDRPPLVARNLITLNTPDAAELEEALKKAGDLPEGGWFRIPFSPGLIEEISGLQGKGRGADDPLD
jgi:hypothetical protein